MKPIEEIIKPLVESLNEVPYLDTFSSCEGEYVQSIDEREREEEPANVRFNVKEAYRQGFGNLRRLILTKTVPHWSEALVEIYERFYVTPEEPMIEKRQWVLEIKPLKKGFAEQNVEEKYSLIRKMVGIMTDAVRRYVKNTDFDNL